MESIATQLKKEVGIELIKNILPYWMKLKDSEKGGFYGEVTGSEECNKEADKGGILHARILWTFSSAFRVTQNKVYREIATHAKRFLLDHFYDTKHGGLYWLLNASGEPIETKKQIYLQGFGIYGLSEYYRATNDKEALEYAQRLFKTIEEKSFDKERNGYFEAFTRTWEPIEDMRLSHKDANERKTMNTHLHILEPYTNLYRVWRDEKLANAIRNLIHLFLDTILDKKSGHLQLFFNDHWESKVNAISYGHDIEASWLIHEAALILKDKAILQKAEPLIRHIAEAAAEGLQPNGGMIYEKDLTNHKIDANFHWWVQAEAIVGYYNIYEYFGDKQSLIRAAACWEFIKTHIIDHTNGEWVWSSNQAGEPNTKEPKAGFWKCPYHNGRMCMELMERKLW